MIVDRGAGFMVIFKTVPTSIVLQKSKKFKYKSYRNFPESSEFTKKMTIRNWTNEH